MSVSAAQMDAFFREIAESGSVWTIEDDAGIPSPLNSDGVRAMPFWSKESRARKIITASPNYANFEAREILLSEWTARWLPGLRDDGLLAGLNWTGPSATGFDLHPSDLILRLGL